MSYPMLKPREYASVMSSNLLSGYRLLRSICIYLTPNKLKACKNFARVAWSL